MSRFLRTGKRPRQCDIQYRNCENKEPVPNLEPDQYHVVSYHGATNHLANEPNTMVDFTQFRSGWKELRQVYRAATKNALAKTIIDGCGWGRLFYIHIPYSDKRLVEGLLKRWWDTTHTFHFPHFEIGFTPLDFTFLTGISIGKGDTPPFDDEMYTEDFEATCEAYFYNMMDYLKLDQLELKAGGIRVSSIKSYILSCKKRDTTGEEEEIARAFMLWMIGQVFFGNASSVVSPGWLLALEDLHSVHAYDWGSAILARIYGSLDKCCRNGRSFSGMSMLLEYWFYTYFHKESTFEPSLIPDVGSMDIWPRVSMYNKDNRAKQQKDTGRHSMHEFHQQVEILTPQATDWTPWTQSQYIGEPDIIASFNLSTHRTLLFDPELDVGFWYLGDRCWRQIHGDIVIPSNPPAIVSLSNVPRSVFLRLRADGWEEAAKYIVYASEEQYRLYWNRVSFGSMKPLRRDGNKEEFSAAATQEPPHHANDVFTYQTQEPSVPYSTYVDWNLRVAGSSGETLSIPITPKSDRTVLPPNMYTTSQWAELSSQLIDLNHMMRTMCLNQTLFREQQIQQRDKQIERLKLRLQEQNQGQTSSQMHGPQTLEDQGM